MSNLRSPAWQRFKQMPRLLRFSTYAVLAYAVYAIILGVIVPAVIEAKTAEIISQQLGRNVSVQKVTINPFLLKARIENFAIKEADDSDTFTRFDTLELQVNFWQSLLTLTPTVDHITLNAPQIALQRLNNGEHTRFNFSDMLDRLTSHRPPDDNSAQTSPSSGAIPAVRIQRLDIAGGKFQFHDDVTGAKLNYDDLNLNLTNFDSRASHQPDLDVPAPAQQANHYSLMIEGADQGQLALNGRFQLAPFQIDGSVELESVTLTPFWPFTADQMQASVTDGALSLSAHYQATEQDQGFHYQISQGQLQLRQLVISDREQPKIKLPALDIENAQLNGDTQQISMDAIHLKGLWADAHITDQGIDIEKIFNPEHVKTTDNQSAPEALQPGKGNDSSSPWVVSVGQFSLRDADINVQESVQSEGVFWRIAPLSVTTGPISSQLNEEVTYNIDMTLSSDTTTVPSQGRGQLSTQGTVNPQTLLADGELTLSQLDLSQVQPYLKPYVNLRLSQGKLSTQGQYRADNKGQVIYQGRAAIKDLLVKDALQQQPLVKWHNMAIDSMQFDTQSKSLNINTIAFDKPYAKVMIAKDKRTNIGDILVTDTRDSNTMPHSESAQSQPQPATSEGSQENAFAVTIKTMTFANGSAYFADNSLTPNFASGIELLHGSIRNLSSTPGTKAQVDISGKIDKYAPVSLKGEINPLIPNPYLDLNLIFKSVELTSVNPYSGTYAGYYIDKGQLSLALNYQLEENRLAGDNHLVIDQLQLGKPSESELATSLPVSLAIAILQDKDGVIDLGVQVSGDVNDPDFSFGSVIFKALSNVIVKAVTAPFSLLANLVGSDEELDHITFAFGDSSLSAEEQQRLDKLAKGLESRPQLILSIAASVSEHDDSRALAEQYIQQQLLQSSGLATLPDPFSPSRIVSSDSLTEAVKSLAETQLKLDLDEQRDKVINQLSTQANDTAPSDQQINTTLLMGLYNQLINAVNISHHQLQNLAEQRAKTIKTYLVDKAMVAPERVFLLDSKTRLRTEDSGAELSLDAK